MSISIPASLTDIYYEGTEEDLAKITIQYGNENLKSATVHFNYTPAE